MSFYEILPPHLAIKSMRSSGYRDTAHAVAELIDNSIQAGEYVNSCTEVEVICVDQSEFLENRTRQRLSQIAVYDNASGMDKDLLRIALQFGNGTHLDEDDERGIGKFGMGLPNASISQCRKVEVWTWQQHECLYTFLDLKDIERGDMREVPEPMVKTIPKYWRDLVRDEVGPHGTLVVWSTLDRVKWKTSRSFLENSELLVGRMYRYFIADGKARIRLAAFEDINGKISNKIDRDVLPNDPLYLMTETSAPEPFSTKPAFDMIGEEDFEVSYQDREYMVKLKFSISSQEPRDQGGNSLFGRHAAKNQGVSVVRARRELEINSSFDRSSDPRDRWWGIEVDFDPELDDVFGVTNNKQSATAFMEMDIDKDAQAEGMTPIEYEEYLKELGDPRIVIYKLSERINTLLNQSIRPQIERMRRGSKSQDGDSDNGSVEDIATQATKRRRERFGDIGRTDPDEQLSTEERETGLTEELIADGLSPEEAKDIAVSNIRRGRKYLFQKANVPGAPIFDVRLKVGTIIILINTNHPASSHLFELLEGEDLEERNPALIGLELLLTAWARMEDEASEDRREILQDIRIDWGRIARDFLREADE